MPALLSGSALPLRGFASALVVDDHPLFCDALAITLRAVAGVGRTEVADSLGAALARLAAGEGVDLVVLDLHLPDVSGLEGLVRLRAAARGAPVVVVSSLDDPRVVAAALQAGAAGFVPKHSGREVFRAALARIGQGGVFVPEGLALAAPAAAAPAEALARLSLLTRQQARILELICEGKLNKQIAYDLAIADATVKAHVTAIMRKLGVQTRTQAVLLARQASFAAILQE
ncbi:Transcriptional regulator, LuxR family [Rubellimicrobium mesophilum DSM 19309]|uniref:Transcriptional regulator, LuxR family n=1 Tax=Rubellimicrobium mesophilum DSM 19309 TaxID=442562 RepID=A0A017HNQ0_9RHOB|nr:response regulator transcription factor [Rubellimicrobium mesophilum]EYD75991.1 Transcriptional regulator, LuxR family [Rubellimicrobium mesophilum DSM 19309]